jgi:hypothetical protein
MSRPLRMTIQLALDDLNSPGPEGTARQLGDGFTTLQANTVGEAKTILREAVTRIDEEVARRPLPRRPRKGRHDRPLRVAVHYDLEDLDRAGPLDVNDCLHLFYDGIPPGLQPRNCHPEYAVYDRPHVRREPPPRRRTLFQRMLGG